GEDRDDARLDEASTLPPEELKALLAYFREGGRENLKALLRRLACHTGVELDAPAPQEVPRMAGYWPGEGAVPVERLKAQLEPGRPVIPILFYRAGLLAADTAPIDELCKALAARALAPAPIFVPSLKDREAATFVRCVLTDLSPAAIITTTAFAANDGTTSPLDGVDAPLLQAMIATTRREAWAENPRGLGPADLAMHVVLPELDGRVLIGALAFKDALPKDEALGFTAFASRPEPDRVAAVADRVAALVRLQQTPRARRRVAVILPDYPGAGGRTGYAVGLDVPASVLALLCDLDDAGYALADVPTSSPALLACLEDGTGVPALSRADYATLLAELPPEIAAEIDAAWGGPEDDPDFRDGAFCFRAAHFGNVTVALPPDRGSARDRRADYHDPTLPPRHALLAFGLWLQHRVGAHALLHL
ncbi:MAG: cobaltochelatase subunit CobN, partial [Burkholderiales bacterium]